MRRFDAVIFDMDGTLVDSSLDFRAIRRELGIPAEQGILEALEALPRDRREPAERRLLERELEAARTACPAPDADGVLQTLRRAGLKLALLTRNARPSLELAIQKLDFRFDLAWSREDGPIKPQPTSVLRACRTMGVRPEATACVGDFRYDVQAANAAGAVSVLLARGEPPEYAREARHVIRGLGELPGLLGV